MSLDNIIKDLKKIKSLSSLEELRVKVVGKSGILPIEFSKLKDLKDKTVKAKELNEFKNEFTKTFDSIKNKITESNINKTMSKNRLDLSMYSPKDSKGSIHPLHITLNRVVDFFTSYNFSIEFGPLLEDEYHNFSALNMPNYHPARDMQDTFYFSADRMLRTHTSPVQIRTMLKSSSPIRIISPGTVFRRDYDVTHTPMFNQLEGLVVGKEGEITLPNLKHIINEFISYFFGDVKTRYRVSYFPFTEPSAEIDISCIFCDGIGCNICSKTGWLEVLGCGMVNDKVFESVGYSGVSGYAFGLGIERFTMLVHKISDLRSLFETDLRLLEQF